MSQNRINTSINNTNFNNYKVPNNSFKTSNFTINTEVEYMSFENFFKPSLDEMRYSLDNPKNFYELLENTKLTYGTDQGIIKRISSFELNGNIYDYDTAKQMINDAFKIGEAIPIFNLVEGKRFTDLKNKIMVEYGFSEDDAEVILNLIDDAGACSYATVCNEIFHQFSRNPKVFKEVFGFDMYRGSRKADGTVEELSRLNTEELIVDLYMFVNDKKNGGNLFEDGKLNTELLSDEVDPLGRQLLDVGDNQFYFSGEGWKEIDMVNKYLKSKNENLSYECSNNLVWKSGESSSCSGWVKEKLNEGKTFTLDYFYDSSDINTNKVVRMQSYNENSYSSLDTTTWNEGSGHSVTITDVTDDGFIVSSWGEKYHIPFEDLKFGENCYLSMTDISIKQFIGGN